MEKIKIKNLIKQVRGVSYKPEDLHSELDDDSVILLRANNIDSGKINLDDVVYVDKSKVSSEQYLRKGDILICASSGSKSLVGKAACVDFDRKYTFGAFCKVVRPNEDIIDYLGVFFQSPVYRRKISEVAIGVNINNIRNEHIDELVVPLYSKNEQRDIVKKILLAQEIISKRKSELSVLDDLIKARFVEMFGDPIQNPKGWDTPLVENVVANEKNALKAGPFGSALKKEYYVESGYKIYGQEQVISGDHTIGNYYIDEERYKALENCAVQAGDVLISLVGTYGKLLIIPDEFEPGIINPRLMKITFDKNKVNPLYFKFFFQSESLKRTLSENTHGGTMDILNLGIVRKISMPLPPLKLQNKFVSFVEQVNKSKVAVQKALDETQLLFDSLMQEHFG